MAEGVPAAGADGGVDFVLQFRVEARGLALTGEFNGIELPCDRPGQTRG